MGYINTTSSPAPNRTRSVASLLQSLYPDGRPAVAGPEPASAAPAPADRQDPAQVELRPPDPIAVHKPQRLVTPAAPTREPERIEPSSEDPFTLEMRSRSRLGASLLLRALEANAWVHRRLSPYRNYATNLTTLAFLLVHSRQLWEPDLALLIRLGAATSADEGRLYTRITDVGLTIEMAVNRRTVVRAVLRLAAFGMLHVFRLPACYGKHPGGRPFRDSRGEYWGTKLYLLADELLEIPSVWWVFDSELPVARVREFVEAQLR